MKKGEKLVTLLLEKCANPNIKNRVTGVPLIHATARSENLDTLKLLLQHHNVDASVTDNKNRTILHWLARVSGKNQMTKRY